MKINIAITIITLSGKIGFFAQENKFNTEKNIINTITTSGSVNCIPESIALVSYLRFEVEGTVMCLFYNKNVIIPVSIFFWTPGVQKKME